MGRWTRYTMATTALVIALVATSTYGVNVGDEGRWLQAIPSPSGSHANEPPVVSGSNSDESSPSPMPVSIPPITPAPFTVTPVSTLILTNTPTAIPPTPSPISTTSAPPANADTRPPGASSNVDTNGYPSSSSPSSAFSPTTSTTFEGTPSSESRIDNGPRSEAARTDGSIEDTSDTNSGSSTSGSDDSSASQSSTASTSSSSSASLPITLPPVSLAPITTAPAPLVNGSQDNSSKTDIDPTTTILKSPSGAHAAIEYICVVCAIMSLVLLVGLHVFAFDAPWLDWPHEWLSANGWEVLVYMGYLQQLGSLSQMELLSMPSFLAQFSDSFAWSSFLVQRTALVYPAPVRRLDESITAKGLAAFGDRIGIDASDLVANGVVGVVVVFAVLCVVYIAFLLCGKKVPEDKFDLENSVVSVAAQVFDHPTHRRGTLWVLGFGVILWFAALYPLTALTSFDLESTHANTALSVVVLVVFCILFLVGFAYVVMSKSDEELMSINMLKVFGALYTDITQSCRWFFVVTALAQIILGICVGTIRDESTQLTVALVITVGYLVVVLLCSPFTSQTPLLLTVAVCGLKILNYSLAFAFVSSNHISVAGRNHAGNAIAIITLFVLLLWLVRVLVILATFVRIYAERRSATTDSPAYYGARESVKEGMNLDTNPILGGSGIRGSGVYVTLMMSPSQRLGSEFGNSFDEILPRHTGRLAQL